MAREHQHNFENFLYIQRVAAKTREAYLRAVSELSTFHQQTPEELTNDQIQEYLFHCIQEKQLAWSSCNVLFCGLKKYYREFLGRKKSELSIPPRPRFKAAANVAEQAGGCRGITGASQPETQGIAYNGLRFRAQGQ